MAEGLAKSIAEWFDKLWEEEAQMRRNTSDNRHDCVLRAARIVLRKFMIDVFPKLVTESVTREIQIQRRRFMENEDHD